MIKNKEGIYQFSSFIPLAHVIHGFSSKPFGSFKSDSLTTSLKGFANALSISPDQIVCMEQVHGSRVVQVGGKNVRSIREADGLVGKEALQFLCVRTADCVPIMAVDSASGVYGVAHAGWKGALYNIASVLIDRMVGAGAKKDLILVGLGPSIRVCCYGIDDERVKKFTNAYPTLADAILAQRNGTSYLNLQQLITEQLRLSGIQRTHIEDSEICTHDVDEFFSYRDKKAEPGLFAGIIGIL